MQSRVSPVRFGRAAGRSQGGSAPLHHRTAPLKSNRLWDRVSWPVSISLFAVPMALALFTFVMPRFSASPEIAIRVTDRYSGQQISGAMLIIGEEAMSTGPDGTITVEPPNGYSTVTIQAPGY